MKKLFYLFILFYSCHLFGNQCLKGSPMNKNYEYELRSAKESIVKEYLEATGIANTAAVGFCIYCSTGSMLAPNLKINQLISQSCIEGALKRQIKQKATYCKDGKPIQFKGNLNSSSASCVNSEVSGYITHVTNKVLNCFNNLELKGGGSLHLSPKTFFKKVNNESGFNFSPSYSGGVGAGQLTGIAVKEMNILSSGRSGNGRYILDSILNSSKPECSSLKEIIRSDKSNKLFLNRGDKSICEWVSINRGLPRSLVYSLGFFTFLRESLKKEIKRYASNLKVDEDLLDSLTLVAYGPKGLSRAKELIRNNLRGSNNQGTMKRIVNNEAYLRRTNKTLKEVKLKTGDSCNLI